MFRLDPIAALGGGGLYARREGRAVIVVDPALPRRERKAVLAHELVHDERGGLVDAPNAPPGWAAVVAREERIVDGIVAGRLVPTDKLAVYVERALSLDDGGVDARMVAVEFDVPEPVAQRALEELEAESRRRHPSARAR